jgi:hypothetical protein
VDLARGGEREEVRILQRGGARDEREAEGGGREVDLARGGAEEVRSCSGGWRRR